ncbi:MAG: thermonuclease family protein [Planctomycetota bacterium]|nr:MAG: thermonuclease family protein [Planctomycetota bacterium]
MRAPLLGVLLAVSSFPLAAQAPPLAAQTPSIRGAAAVCPITRVVDGDTIWVKRGDKEEKLRLLCVDTEETIKKGASDPGKPQTVFGDETMHWAKQLFAGLDAADGAADGVTHIGLAFPGGAEKRDSFGRLLCHVLLPDGADYNLRLVREGWSPYFNKYGNSELAHAQFVQAQQEARAAHRGVWDPATNAPATEGAPSVKRDYAAILPWWDARAEAISAFQARLARHEEGLYDAEDPASIAAALAWCEKTGKPATLFGSFEALFAETDGSHTLMFRGPGKQDRLRALVGKDAWAALAPLKLESRAKDDVQNYVYVRGKLTTHPRGGAALQADELAQWQVAQPEFPAPKQPASAVTPAGAKR